MSHPQATTDAPGSSQAPAMTAFVPIRCILGAAGVLSSSRSIQGVAPGALATRGGLAVDWSNDMRVFVIAVLTSGATGIATGWASYLWGRKAKVDEVRIAKSHELLQSLAVSFQKVHQSNEHLPRWFQSNFELLPSFPARVERLREFASGLYADAVAEIKVLQQEKAKLADLLLQGHVYLPSALCNDVSEYLDACQFGWMNAAVFDNYLEGLFENLLDETKAAQRSELAKQILSGLTKAAG